MRLPLLFSLLVLNSLLTVAQKNFRAAADSIQSEGERLYISEIASWDAGDRLSSLPGAIQNNFRGYISYTEGRYTKCIFLSKADANYKIATFSYMKGQDLPPIVDTTYMPINKLESKYWRLKAAAVQNISSDTFFHAYPGTILNLVPIITGYEKRVYVLTGTFEKGLLIIGNDYLLEFDQFDHLFSKTCFHRDLTKIPFKSDSSEKSALHNHVPPVSSFMTATDYCTLLLYSRYTTWRQYFVVSKKVVSILDYSNRQLRILSTDAYSKMTEK